MLDMGIRKRTFNGKDSPRLLHINNRAREELQQKAEEGFLLFTKWLPNMWD